MSWEKVYCMEFLLLQVEGRNRIQGLFLDNDDFLNLFYDTKNKKFCILIEGQGLFLAFGL